MYPYESFDATYGHQVPESVTTVQQNREYFPRHIRSHAPPKKSREPWLHTSRMESYLPSSSEIMSRRYDASASYESMMPFEPFGPQLQPNNMQLPSNNMQLPSNNMQLPSNNMMHSRLNEFPRKPDDYTPFIPIPSGPVMACPQVCQHVTACPFCSQFYKTNILPYILIIIFLSLLVLILAIKVLWF